MERPALRHHNHLPLLVLVVDLVLLTLLSQVKRIRIWDSVILMHFKLESSHSNPKFSDSVPDGVSCSSRTG